MQLENAVRIKKSFTLDSVKEIGGMGSDTLPSILLTGYASRGYTDTGHKAIDLDGETINQYGIDVSRLETGNIPLLFQHDQSKIIGKVTSASYDTKGLFVTAELTKLPGDSLTNYVYEAVKAGMLNSFSVGLMVQEIDWTEDDMIEITKSHLFELSVVSTPALAEATFSSTVIKSADGSTSKSFIPVDALKEDNPEMCDTLGCLLKSAKKETPVDKTKEIDNEDTVVEAPKAADEGLETPEGGPDVVVEDDAVEPEVPAASPTEADTAKEVTEPEPEPTPEPEVTKEEEAPSKTSEVDEEEDTADVKTEPTTPEPENTEEEPMTLEDAISLLSEINIEDLSDDELEAVFETVSTLADAVEKKVVAEIAAVMLSEHDA